MIKKLLIRTPSVTDAVSMFFEQGVRLSAVIESLDEEGRTVSEKTCYFEFSSEYKAYLDDGRSDAFVLGLLSAAMEYGYDIGFEAPISKRLCYQLDNFYIPLISRFNEKYPMHCIALDGPVTEKSAACAGAVATGCSGGVDSFYTIVKYRDGLHGEKLTHLVCSSSGTLDHNIDRINKSYRKILDYVRRIGADAGLPVIGCFNNLYEFYAYPYKSFNTFFTTTFCAVALALDKLVSIYYVNSGIPENVVDLDITTVPGRDCSVFDVFTVQCLCTESTTFYSSGFETANRNEKIAFLADDSLAQKYLAVCGAEMDGADIPYDVFNCSKCKKCIRTMFSLYAINKLDGFSKTFDTNDFKRNLGKRIGAALAYDHKEFNDVSIRTAKENGVGIPATAFLYKWFVFIPLELCRRAFRRFPLIKKIGYALKIDYFMGGYRRGKNDD